MTERELFFRHMGLPSFAPMGLEIDRAEGIYLYSPGGESYMDLVSGITVSNVGHRHPRVVAAIHEQVEKYLHLNVYGEFIQSPQVRLAERLTQLLPQNLDAVYFVNSGSEAVEGALKLAKRFTGRSEIVSFIDSYHGSTHGSLSILGHEGLKNAFRPLLPGITHIAFNDAGQLHAITDRTACVVVEMIQAEAGIVPADPAYIRLLREQCDRTGALLIVDDVQMGMGRTGRMFSFERYGVVPDILVLAKALGGGMPLGAFIAARKVMDSLAFNPELGHITTFGGHPVSCAAALAALEVLTEGILVPEAENKGTLFEETLAGHPALSAIRRAGFALGLDLADERKKSEFARAALGQGLIIDWYLFRPATFRIAPPLTITEVEIGEACKRLIESLGKIE